MEWHDYIDALTTARKHAKWDDDAAAIANAQERISDLERRLKEVEGAARAVVWFDWSSCDDLDDGVIDALVTLRRVIGPEPPIGDDPNQ